MTTKFYLTEEKALSFETFELKNWLQPNNFEFEETPGIIVFITYDAANKYQIKHIKTSENVSSAFKNAFALFGNSSTHVCVWYTSSLGNATDIANNIQKNILN